VLAPDVAVQLIHEDDVGQALLLCAVGAGPPGAYNIAADDTLTGAEIAEELGLNPLPIPARCSASRARPTSNRLVGSKMALTAVPVALIMKAIAKRMAAIMASMAGPFDQPTTRREKVSSTTAQYTLPS